MQTGTYRHCKHGTLYQVLTFALDVESQKKMVVYQSLQDVPELADGYGIRPVFVRPYDVFFETIEWNGQTVPRFALVA